MTAAGGEAAFREQHERVVQEVGRLAGERVARGRRSRRPLGRGVVLGGEEDLGRLLGDLAADRVDAAGEQRRRVRARRAVGGARGDRRPERLEPGEALRRRARPARPSGSKQLRVPRWQVGPAGSTVTSSASASQSVARSTSRRTLPLVSPLRQSRSREREWKWTSPVASVAASASASIQASISTRPSRGVLDDRRDEAVGAEATAAGDERAPSRDGLPGRAGPAGPAAAIAALTSAIEWIRRWKIEAARTASAPPSRTAATKSAGPAAPPDAMTGTRTRERDRPEQRGVEAGAGPVAVDRGDQQLAGAELDGALGPGDRVETGRLAAALDDDLPRRARPCRTAAGIDRDDDRLAPEPARRSGDQRRVRDGRAC